jgi:pimeloyl-ACP methyl ester carboxylesterase
MKKVYFISGLGADKRAFSFLDLSFCEPVYIEWIKPLPKESLKNYALRLKDQIPDPSPVIIGVSFGGMLATEIAKSDPSAKAIIIASNKTKNEFPKIFLAGKYVPAYKWVPPSLLKKATLIRNKFFGPKGEKQKEMFKQILKDTDTNFSKWAIYSILHWDNAEIPANLTHIHGTSDRLLPYRLVKADFAIKGGSHLMVMNQHDDISALLKKLIV